MSCFCRGVRIFSVFFILVQHQYVFPKHNLKSTVLSHFWLQTSEANFACHPAPGRRGCSKQLLRRRSITENLAMPRCSQAVRVAGPRPSVETFKTTSNGMIIGRFSAGSVDFGRNRRCSCLVELTSNQEQIHPRDDESLWVGSPRWALLRDAVSDSFSLACPAGFSRQNPQLGGSCHNEGLLRSATFRRC